ncbi:hypothetical protein D9M68_850850 [compost metagenome]
MQAFGGGAGRAWRDDEIDITEALQPFPGKPVARVLQPHVVGMGNFKAALYRSPRCGRHQGGLRAERKWQQAAGEFGMHGLRVDV